MEAATGKLYVDVAFWGGVVPGNTSELAKLWEAGVVGFKCFLIHSGVDEFPNVTEKDLREAMPELARLGALLIVHAEVPGPVEACCRSASEAPARSYETFLRSRPREAENEAIAMMIRLCRETGCRVHIVHHSSADALPMLRKAKSFGLPIRLRLALIICTLPRKKFATEQLNSSVARRFANAKTASSSGTRSATARLIWSFRIIRRVRRK